MKKSDKVENGNRYGELDLHREDCIGNKNQVVVG